MATPSDLAGGSSSLSISKFGNTTVRETDKSIGTAKATILPNDPKRLMAIIVNNGTATVFISTQETPTTTTGIPISPNGGTATLHIEEDGAACQWAWYAISGAAAQAVHTLEVNQA